MGIPYSKQINAAFDQVTPLVAAGFEVLQTTKNISILLATIQVITVFVLTGILIAVLGLLITVNPDLARERREIVTPIVRWGASWFMPGFEGRTGLLLLLWSFVAAAFVGGIAGYFATSTDIKNVTAPEDMPSPFADKAGEDGVDYTDAKANGKAGGKDSKK